MAARATRSLLGLTLDPRVVGTLHFVLTRGPKRVRDPLLGLLSSRLSPAAVATLIKTLKWLLLLGVGRKINARLNQLALNNWRWTSQRERWTWDWEVAVVTGGSSGIGMEIVKALAARGVRVAVLDVQSLPADLEGQSKITYIKCDVTSPSSIAAAAGEVRALLGEPSILVNNAGVGRPHSIVDTSTEWATKIFQINIISHFWLTREFLPDMIKKNKGHVVGLASMASFVAPPGIVDYASTKAAVMAFHEGLGQEIKHVYKSPGVLNTVVHPSWVRTALTHGYEEHLEKTQGGLMKPEHVGRKIADQIFSCSGGQLVIPRRLSVAAGLRGHANWVHQAILDFSVGGAAADFPAPEK